MSDLIMPFAIMALTFLVLGALIVCFKKWLVIRDGLDAPQREAPRGRSAMHAAE